MIIDDVRAIGKVLRRGFDVLPGFDACWREFDEHVFWRIEPFLRIVFEHTLNAQVFGVNAFDALLDGVWR